MSVTAVAPQHAKEKMMDEMSEYVLLVFLNLKKSFQLRITDEDGAFDILACVARVGPGCDVVEAFRTLVLQIDGPEKDPEGPVAGCVAADREYLEDMRRCAGLC